MGARLKARPLGPTAEAQDRGSARPSGAIPGGAAPAATGPLRPHSRLPSRPRIDRAGRRGRAWRAAWPPPSRTRGGWAVAP
eukprot:scaffold4190_cov141-Isochrysis_galbana.AAC.1